MNKRTTKILLKLLIIIISLGLASCISLNSHQTGKTVGKDNYSIFGNFNTVHIDSGQYFSDEGYYMIMEIGVYHGLKENFDLGFKVNSYFFITGISKYQFIGNKTSIFASSVGLNIGVGVPFGLIMEEFSYSSSLSLFNSIHPTDYLEIKVSPRYTYFKIMNISKNHIYGYSVGLIIGNKHQFSFELSQYVNNTYFSFDTKPTISLGYIWNIK